METLSAHKDRQALDLLKNAGVAVRFLPAYSPYLNPIGLMLSKGEGASAQGRGRTKEAPVPGNRRRALNG